MNDAEITAPLGRRLELASVKLVHPPLRPATALHAAATRLGWRHGCDRNAQKEIAPYAADVDEHSRFPDEALEVLNDTGSRGCTCPRSHATNARAMTTR
jgi:hypothetical protein